MPFPLQSPVEKALRVLRKNIQLQDYWVEKLKSMGHDAFFVNENNVNDWRMEVMNKGRK